MKWAEKLGVSTSGYYTWLKDRDRRQKVQKTLVDLVTSIFNEGEGTYGVDRICSILRRDGESASYPVPCTNLCMLTKNSAKSHFLLFVTFGTFTWDIL